MNRFILFLMRGEIRCVTYDVGEGELFLVGCDVGTLDKEFVFAFSVEWRLFFHCLQHD